MPAYPPADALTAHLADAVQRPEMARYTPIVGRDDLRNALAAALSEAYGGAATRDRVAITAGCNQAFCLALMALAGPGDEAILAAPSYFNYQMWLEMLGIAPVYLPFRPERGGVPDPADAAARITPRTRAIVLVTPNNPTGAIYPPAVIEGFHRLAREAGLALVLDETYRDFLPGDGPPHDLFAREDWDETLVQLYSFSKVYSLTGYRVGALVAGAGLLAEVAKAADCVAICAPAIAQEAALYGLNHLADFRADKRRLVLERVAQFPRGLRAPGPGLRADLRRRLLRLRAPPVRRHACRRSRPKTHPGRERALPARQRLRPRSGGLPALRPRQHRRRRHGPAGRSSGRQPDVGASVYACSKRPISKPSIGVSVRPSRASSAATAPEAGPRQKPWPLKPKA